MNRRILKSFTLLALIGCAVSAHAVAPGFYMGLMMGPATNSASTLPVQAFTATPPGYTVQANPRSTQFGSRIYMGYKMNKYASAEGGFSYFSGIHYDTKDVQTCSGATARVRDIDFVGKGAMPIGELFDVFAKAGVAAVYQTNSGSLNPNLASYCGKTVYDDKLAPTFSIGASYTINQNWLLDATATRIMVGGVVNTVDFYALGLSFHIVDVFCGQFLCN